MLNYHKRSSYPFWKWFSKHEHEFRTQRSADTSHSKLVNYFYKYSPYLDFDIYHRQNENKYELVISADGDPELFESVFEIVNKAPVTLKDRWIFTPLRQPAEDDVDILIHLPEFTIKTEDIIYELEPSEEEPLKADLFVNIKGVKYDNEEAEEYICDAVLKVLDFIIGEYACGTKISELILVEDGELLKPKNIKELKKDINKSF